MDDTEIVEVKYNNDLNAMPMPKFNGRHLDLFYSILAYTNDNNKNSLSLLNFWNPKKRQIEIPITQFVKICRADKWNRNFIEVVNEIETFLELIVDYTISYETPRAKYHFVCFEEAKWDKFNQTIRVTFQQRFYDMVVNYKLGYTKYELAEFTDLTSIYTKRLYAHLKQFRQEGWWLVKWDDFKMRMQIPNTYKSSDIDKQVLKQAIKELTAERTLLGQKRIPFKNLTYEKLTINQEPNKRKLTPYWIKFTFEPQTDSPQAIVNHLKGKIYKTQASQYQPTTIYKIVDIKLSDEMLELHLYELDANLNRKFSGMPHIINEETTLKDFANYVAKNEILKKRKLQGITQKLFS